MFIKKIIEMLVVFFKGRITNEYFKIIVLNVIFSLN